MMWSKGSPLDPLGYALGGGIGTGLVNARDDAKMQNYLAALAQQQYGPTGDASSMMSPALGNFGAPPQGNMPAPPQMPNFWSPQNRAMAQQQMMQSLPLGPMQQAQLENTQAQTGYYNAQAQARMRTTGAPQRLGEDNPYGLPSGSVVQFDPQGGMKILYQPPTEEDQTNVELKKEQLEAARSERMSQLSPEGRKAMQQTELDLKKESLLRARFDRELDPIRRQKLEAEVKKLGTESPTEKLAQLKLDRINAFNPSSPEYTKALGFDSPVDLPPETTLVVTGALELIANGESPMDVYTDVLRLQPDLRRYAAQLKRVLIPTQPDIFAELMSRYLKEE